MPLPFIELSNPIVEPSDGFFSNSDDFSCDNLSKEGDEESSSSLFVEDTILLCDLVVAVMESSDRKSFAGDKTRSESEEIEIFVAIFVGLPSITVDEMRRVLCCLWFQFSAGMVFEAFFRIIRRN
jgi:hypothetical protein